MSVPLTVYINRLGSDEKGGAPAFLPQLMLQVEKTAMKMKKKKINNISLGMDATKSSSAN